MNEQDLRRIYTFAKARIPMFIAPLKAAMLEFGIDTPIRQAAFLAQVGHESGQLRYVRELASGATYEGRKDLGNTHAGDGIKFKGRGLIQITGRFNYTALSAALGIDCLNYPELLETPENACRSAGWFWDSRKLNVMADNEDQIGLCRRINGGLNGFADRVALYITAKEVLC